MPPNLSSFSGNPTGIIIPHAEGDLCIDIATPAIYQATGVTASDWELASGGGAAIPAGTLGKGLYATGTSSFQWARSLEVCDVVKEYGAKFDGTSDDTVALTNALADAATSRCIIQMPPGIARLTSLATHGTLTVPDGVCFRGAGPGATSLNGGNLSGFTGPIITVSGAGSIVSDFCLQYDSTGTTHANDGILVNDDYPAWGSFTGGGSFATLANLLVWNIAGNGITLDAIEARAINCYVIAHALSTGNGGYGFYVPNTDNFLIGCTADHCGDSGFLIDGANTKVNGCKAFGNGFSTNANHGFALSGAGRHMLVGCEAQDNLGDGYHVYNSAPANDFAGCLADTNGIGGVSTVGFSLYGNTGVSGCGAINRSGSSQTIGFFGRDDGSGNKPSVSGCWSQAPGSAHTGGVFAYCQVGMPTADPHVVGQVWSNGGVLTRSAG